MTDENLGPFGGIKIVQSPHLPKDTVYVIGVDPAFILTNVELPPPSRWVRFNRWLFARWWGAR